MTTGEGGGAPSPSRAGVELSGTVQQQLVFLNTHWGGKYSFTTPAKPRGRWTAAAKFGQREELTGETAAELLERVHAPLPGKQAGRGRAMTSHEPVVAEMGRQATLVVAAHPEQGWSLLRKGVVVFDGTGVLLPGGWTQPGRALPDAAIIWPLAGSAPGSRQHGTRLDGGHVRESAVTHRHASREGMCGDAW